MEMTKNSNRRLEGVEKINSDVIKKTKNKKSVVKKTPTGKDRDTCPLCGWKMVDSDAGMWCVNPACSVLDDADNYR